MCKHCEKLVEDADAKEIVHKFMERAAVGVNRTLRERGTQLMKPITADDIEIDLKINATVWHENPIAKKIWSDPSLSARVMRLLDNSAVE